MNLTWTMDDEGTLTISGIGKMQDHIFSLSPFAQSEMIKTVIIKPGVTSIASWAFEGCTSLTSVTIPDSVTRIGEGAFYGCSSLTTVTLPDSVTSVGESAFKYCTSLTSLTTSCSSLGNNPFDGCKSLTSITYSAKVEYINDSIFSYDELLEFYTNFTSIMILNPNCEINCDLITNQWPSMAPAIIIYGFPGSTAETYRGVDFRFVPIGSDLTPIL